MWDMHHEYYSETRLIDAFWKKSCHLEKKKAVFALSPTESVISLYKYLLLATTASPICTMKLGMLDIF